MMFELMTEVTYPVRESLSFAILSSFSLALSAIFNAVLMPYNLINNPLIEQYISICTIFLLAVALFLFKCDTFTMKRTQIDLQ